MRWKRLVAAMIVLGCGRGDVPREGAVNVDESAATDVIGRPEGADSVPPEMRDRDSDAPRPVDSLDRQAGDRQAKTPSDSEFKRPERRPVRNVPPLTRPDTTP
ncbi:MAG: hypothetical protein ACR2HZ_00495 [Gemmatimonadaceae bacterium]